MGRAKKLDKDARGECAGGVCTTKESHWVKMCDKHKTETQDIRARWAAHHVAVNPDGIKFKPAYLELARRGNELPPFSEAATEEVT